MQNQNAEEEIKALDKKLLIINIIDFPAMILVALGLFGKFTDDPGSMHPLLENPNATTGMLIAGGIVAAWCAVQIIAVARRRSELQKKINK